MASTDEGSRAFMDRMPEPASAVSEPAAAALRTGHVALADLFRDEHARLLRALYLVTGNRQEAEEVMQDAFLAVWERWDRVGAMDEPTGYLYRTAMNRHRSVLRQVARAARRVVGAGGGGDAFAQADEREAGGRRGEPTGDALERLETRRHRRERNRRLAAGSLALLIAIGGSFAAYT